MPLRNLESPIRKPDSQKLWSAIQSISLPLQSSVVLMVSNLVFMLSLVVLMVYSAVLILSSVVVIGLQATNEELLLACATSEEVGHG